MHTGAYRASVSIAIGPTTVRIARSTSLPIAVILFCASASPNLYATQCQARHYNEVSGTQGIYDHAARSTVRLVGSAGSCTGVLLNNVHQDGRLLVATARHCLPGDTDEAAAYAERLSLVFGAAACEGINCSHEERRTVHGAALLMDWGDMALLDFDDELPPGLTPYYAGVLAATPESSPLFSTHYAQKRDLEMVWQSINGPPRQYVLARNTPPLGVTAWHTTLRAGRTAPGASGSALFEPGGLVIGVLSTGTACGGDGGSAYYQQVGDAWGHDRSARHSLAAWLTDAEISVVGVSGHDSAAAVRDDPRIVAGLPEGDAGAGAPAPFALVAFWFGRLLLRRPRKPVDLVGLPRAH